VYRGVAQVLLHNHIGRTQLQQPDYGIATFVSEGLTHFAFDNALGGGVMRMNPLQSPDRAPVAFSDRRPHANTRSNYG
jgi:hypothetical protein